MTDLEKFDRFIAIVRQQLGEGDWVSFASNAATWRARLIQGESFQTILEELDVAISKELTNRGIAED